MHAAPLRRVLLNQAIERHNCKALIPPTVSTPRQLLWRQISRETPSLHRYRRSLILASVLLKHPDLFPISNRWQLAEQLLALFEEMEENHLLGHMVDTGPLDEEAERVRQVYTLWKTWSDPNDSEAELFYQHALVDNKLVGPTTFVCDFGLFSPLERHWIQGLEEQGLCRRSGESEASANLSGSYTQGLKTVFEHQGKTVFGKRLKDFKQQFPDNPYSARVQTFNPTGLEEHAFGLYLKIADWLAEGRQDLAVVTQDRKLARRLRAVLDDHGVPLRDYAGWALSTSSAAASLSALLADGQTHFGLDQLTVLALSPWCKFRHELKDAEAACHALRLACIRANLLPNDLSAIAAKAERLKLDDESRTLYASIGDGLLSLAAEQEKETSSFDGFFASLFAVMRQLGLWASFSRDWAGRRTLEELRLMQKTAAEQSIQGSWLQWRGWIMHALEHRNFIPPAGGEGGVCLYNVKQSWWLSADAVVLAAMDSRYAQPARYQLFNDKILEELGLQTSKQAAQWMENQCRRLLESADTALISWQGSDGGQILHPAAWLDSLQHFCRSGWREELADKNLAERARTMMRMAHQAKQPDWPGQRAMPKPKPPAAALPKKISAAAYQSLLDCPYQFFSRYCLKLHPREDRFSFSRLRYGEILHRCLYRFHQQLKAGSWTLKPAEKTKDFMPEAVPLPETMNVQISDENQTHAKQLAQDIVEKEFAELEEDYYPAHHQKLEASIAIEGYIDWLFNQDWLERARFENEVDMEKEIGEELILRGRADCIVDTPDHRGIVDYKSGASIAKKSVAEGHTIQLLAYKTLAENVDWVCYLFLGRTIKAVKLAGKELQKSHACLTRQIETMASDYGKQPLPAWAHEKTCRYCDYSGVCRRKDWYAHG